MHAGIGGKERERAEGVLVRLRLRLVVVVVVRGGGDDGEVVAGVVEGDARAEAHLAQETHGGVETFGWKIREERPAAGSVAHLAVEEHVVLHPSLRILDRGVDGRGAGLGKPTHVVRDDALQQLQRILAADAKDATAGERHAGAEHRATRFVAVHDEVATRRRPDDLTPDEWISQRRRSRILSKGKV